MVREHPDHTATGPLYDTTPLPKYEIPSVGTSADTAYEVIHKELSLDGNPLLNLASFVHTHMAPQADKLMAENVSKVRALSLGPDPPADASHAEPHRPG